MAILWLIVAALAVVEFGVLLAFLFHINRQWRPLIRGYLERRVGERLPEPTPLIAEDAPGRAAFPDGDNADAYRVRDF